MSLILALLLAAAQDASRPPEGPSGPPPAAASAAPRCTPSAAPPSRRIARLLASATGATAATAYRVRNVGEEYEIVAALGLCPQSQSLATQGGHPYDILDTVDARTGAARSLWFDIGAFFGREF